MLVNGGAERTGHGHKQHTHHCPGSIIGQHSDKCKALLRERLLALDGEIAGGNVEHPPDPEGGGHQMEPIHEQSTDDLVRTAARDTW